MYEKFFSLAHRPFAAAPNLECIVAHEGYIDAREKLLRCLTDGCGTAILTAPAGLGKSLLCQDLQSRLRSMFTVAYLCSAQFPNRKAMLQAILFELGAEYLGLSEDEARLCITQAAQEAAERGRSLIIIVDEAHLVSTELLQELRALAEPSPRCATPARLMLAGQLELEERLADQELDSLNQRIACHAILEPLTQAESAEYLLERLAIAGAKTQLFTEEAMAFIVKAADGNPRALHQLADHCLLSAYTIEEKPVSLETARNSLDDLRALPLHWNDTGILDEAPGDEDEALDDAGDEEFVSTVEAPTFGGDQIETSAGFMDATNESQDPGPLWGDSSDLGVIEVGGETPAAVEPPMPPVSELPQISEAALFASVAPWPAVPVESISAHRDDPHGHEWIEAEEAPQVSQLAEVECEETAPEPTAEATIEEHAIEEQPVASEELASEQAVSDPFECELIGEPIEAVAEAGELDQEEAEECSLEECELNSDDSSMSDEVSAAMDGVLESAAEEVAEAVEEELAETAEDVSDVDAGDDFTLHEPAVAWSEPDEIDESQEDTVTEPGWARQVELLDELEADDFEDEEIVINDHYAALDRASQALSNYLPQAPELLQFLSQYSVNRESRTAHGPASMHQSAVGIAENEDTTEEELLATIRGLQQQLREAAAERPRPREPWQESVEPMAYDVVEPPEEVVAPVVAPKAEIERPIEAVVETKPAEPVRSRFAQLFSRMRQRRREVEDRLRKNADWI